MLLPFTNIIRIAIISKKCLHSDDLGKQRYLLIHSRSLMIAMYVKSRPFMSKLINKN